MIELRDAVTEDAERIGAVHYTAWMETYRGLLADAYLDSQSAERSSGFFRKNGCANIITALDRDRIIGFASFLLSGELKGLYILKDYQDMGYGKALFRETEKRLSSAGCGSMYLWVLSTNLKAVGFYNRMGMSFSGITKQETLGLKITELKYIKTLGK